MDVAVHHEIERKLDVDDDWVLPTLPPEVGVARPARRLVLSATYYDTDDLRLARHHITLRRREGGHDDGWHLKLPAGGEHSRDELHLPLGTPGDPPLEFVWMVFGFTRGSPLAPAATLINHRRPVLVRAVDGAALAEITDDHVTVERDGQQVATFREVEVEAAEGRTDADLDGLVAALLATGARPGSFASKAVRALGLAAQGPADVGRPGDSVLGDQVLALQHADLAVRRRLPGAVDQFAVALTAVRHTLKANQLSALWREAGGVAEVLDRTATDPPHAELVMLLREPRYAALLDLLVAAACDDRPITER